MARAIDHDKRRRELARACLPLFARDGYGVLNMRRIAAELGVSTGVVYHYFPGKAALFEAVVHASVEAEVEEGTRLLRGASSDPRERLASLIAYTTAKMPNFVMRYRVLSEYATQLGGDVQVAAWGATLAALRERYARAIGEVLELTDARVCDMVLLTICGLILRSMCGDPFTDIDGVVVSLRRMIGWEQPA